jgi:GxxExxY protein
MRHRGASHSRAGSVESTYRQCLAYELSHAQIRFQMELPLPVRYKDVLLDCGYRIDLLVSGDLIVEVKAVEMLLPIHQAQILTYMRLAKIPIGLLINFNVTKLQKRHQTFRPINFFVLFASFVVRLSPLF